MAWWHGAVHNNIDLLNSVLQKIQKIIYKKYKHLPEFEEEYKKSNFGAAVFQNYASESVK